MSNPIMCEDLRCPMGPFSTSSIARHHRYRYHSVPVPFTIAGCKHIVGLTDEGHYTCPFQQCIGRSFKKREAMQLHVSVDHYDSKKLKIFGTPVIASPMDGGSDAIPQHTSSVQRRFIAEYAAITSPGVLIPAIHSPPAVVHSIPLFGVDTTKVSLLPSVDYLMSNEVLDALGVCLHSGLKILLCLTCRVALTSGMLVGHRKKFHCFYRAPTAALQALLEFCSESDVYEKPEHVKLPTAGGPPVQLISDPSDGLACTASLDCTYAVKDLQTMQRHGREKHSTRRLEKIYHRPCQVQQIFTGVGNSYFEIRQNIVPGSRPDVKMIIQTQFLPTLDIALVVPADTERERTPLMRFMGWDKFLLNVRMNPVQRRAADDIKKKHTVEEHGGLITRLAATVREHMEKASTILDGHPHRFSLSKLLLYGRDIPRDIDCHWRPVSDANVEYPNFMVQMMRAIVRIHLGSPLEFSFALSAVQNERLETFLTDLHNDASSARKRLISYHNLAWSLIDTDPDLCVVDRWANPIKRAVWLRALRADGNFCEASTLTPDLAKFKYFCNTTALLEALMDKDQDVDAVHFDDHNRVTNVHERVLRLGRPNTFNMIYEMQQYASSVVFNQTKEPNVYVDPDVKSITIGTQTMHMDKLRGGIQTMIVDFKKRYAQFTNKEILSEGMPDEVKDDLTNTTRGYSLMSEEPFYKKRHDMFYYLIDNYKLAMVDNAGRVSWNIPEVMELLRRSLLVWEPLYHLLFITTHISARGTQFVDHKISNADRHRNMFMQMDEMFLMTTYSKKTGITDRDSCTPGFVPREVAFYVLQMLGGGFRTAEAILARIAYGADAEHLYRTYLCVGEGERISPTMFSANLQDWNSRYFDCRWGVRDFRQGAITIGREFIAPDDSYDQADSILAESADHSTGMDHSHYAIIQGVVPRLSNNSMCKHRWLGDQWHSVLGLGPLPPPQAIRTNRKNMANGTTLQSLSDLVKKTTLDTLNSFFTGQYADMLKDAVSTAFIQGHQYEQARGEMPVLASSYYRPQSINLPDNLDELFHNPSDGVLLASGSPSQSWYFPDGMSSPDVEVSPTATSSSIEKISHFDHMGGVLQISDVVPTSDPRDLFTPPDRKGKGRAYEPGQLRASDAKFTTPPHKTRDDSVVQNPSSSISPIAVLRVERRRANQSSTVSCLKEKGKAYEHGQLRPHTPSTMSSKRQDVVDSMSQHVSSTTSKSTSAPVARARYLKHVRGHVSETEDEEETSRSLKRLRRHGIMGRSPVDVISLSSDDELSGLDENLPLKRLTRRRTSRQQDSMDDMWLSSENDENQPIKSLFSSKTTGKKVLVDMSRPSSDDSMSDFIVHDSSQPSSPPSAVRKIRDEIRRAIQIITKDPSAREKSDAQMDALISILTEDTDIVLIMKTGGGKSMAWIVPSVLDDSAKSIVVCPFVALLDQQYKNSVAAGLRCHNYCTSKNVPDNVQILFVQVEHCSGQAFSSFLVSPLGKKFGRLFVDEFHDILNCHPGRIERWKALARQFSAMCIKILLLTATGPPARISSLIKPFGLKRKQIMEVRSSTNRPEIGMHVVNLQPIAARQSLILLVSALSKRLTEEERMLVFCSTQSDVEGIAQQAKCASYHSNLWGAGNTKAYNLHRWDEGESKVMVCTTAFAQGMDRPSVRYVVIFKPSFGLIVNNQMLGRAGRDGRESHVFFLTDDGGPSFRGPSTDQCVGELNELVHGSSCRRFINMQCMDGDTLAMKCTDDPTFVLCDVCDPDSAMQQFAMKIIQDPFRSMDDPAQAPAPVLTSASVLQIPVDAPKFIPAACHPAVAACLPLAASPAAEISAPEPSQPLTQSSDSLFDQCGPGPTEFETMMLNAMEVIHGPGTVSDSGLYTAQSQPSAGSSAWVTLPPPSSLPTTFVGRAGRVNEALRSRLERTSRLDRYMRVLRGKCPAHFGRYGKILADAYHSCDAEAGIPTHLFRAFRPNFSFERFTYCFQCGLPQNRNGNAEEPACHVGFSYKKGEKCRFAGFIFSAVFHTWHTDGFRNLMVKALGAGVSLKSYDEFLIWIVQETPDEGKYNNLLEVFLWFCGEVERVTPKAFD
ncbi:hypothetical protein DEU56DRAFT_918156 [Suillus clintonianus]|uniref:uncharacterized protein n=1 Tax=Suillus clintonianus TaxID=1904413 RepID=UPI001B8667B0|nr:uncharacterized protein DEU56DRAFT_918156 [Suillus clintonianus]KAG2121470.1 hypothetical protein DEU56DRAFT_918156 [Suillus clintonianus]